MATAQVHRFQQRVSNLQSHHKLASIRHCEAVNSYVNQNNALMNCLLINLKAADKNVKRTKRTTKPRNTHSHLKKSARFTGKSYAMQPPYVEQTNTMYHHSIPRQTNCVNRCFTKELWNEFGTTGMGNEQFACNSKEPIFPPPTYAEPSEPAIFDDCSWKNWLSDDKDRNDNVILQNKWPSATLQPDYTLCSNNYSCDEVNSFVYNETLQEKRFWSSDNPLNDRRKQTANFTSDFNFSVPQSVDSYWLKQSTSYSDIKHSPLANTDSYVYDETLYARQNSFRSSSTHNIISEDVNCFPINRIGNYSLEYNPLNINCRISESCKNSINPILASTYPPSGSNSHYYHSTTTGFHTDECLKPHYNYMPYYPSDYSSNSNNNNNCNESNLSDQPCTDTSLSAAKHSLM
ncbi:unnamed protein product [Trichobilharzia szidati]|nr:unnamed protein product [Trichobilharzia szidati]